jgi:hypothetical protein
MVITAKELWLQGAHQTSNDRSPVYCLTRESANEFGIAHGLLAVWKRRWDGAKQIDLNAVREQQPDWDKIVNLQRFTASPGSGE